MSRRLNCEEFYRERDQRTVEVLGQAVKVQTPVHLVIDALASRTAVGQLLVLGLANQLVRVHRRVTFDLAVAEHPILVPSIFRGGTIAELLVSGARQIDPCGSFALASHAPASAVTVGVGPGAPAGLPWYVGARGSLAMLDRTPLPLDADRSGTARGAALASCLGAAAVFRSIHGLPSIPRVLSAWNYAEGASADPGPEDLSQLDVGRVLLVGAGAVGSALVYWLHAFGVGGTWSVIDADIVKLHNTNRSLLFLPVHAGWGGARPAQKADVLARWLPGATPEAAWYHQAMAAASTFDVILALANDYDVRTRISTRSAPITLHATTGVNWISQLHRHIPGRDDCIRCRTADLKVPSFRCSDGILPETDVEGQGDAALPFLSAASGLMLTTALQRLQAGVLARDRENDWIWYWDSTHRMAQSSVRGCRNDCRQLQPAEVRRAMNAGTLWAGLDAG